MKNIQSYIIVGMTILIVVLFWLLNSANSSLDVYKQKIELSKLNNEKVVVLENINRNLNDLSKLSDKTVIKSKSIIKKITYEATKISDTTDMHMLEYISSFRPKTD